MSLPINRAGTIESDLHFDVRAILPQLFVLLDHLHSLRKEYQIVLARILHRLIPLLADLEEEQYYKGIDAERIRKFRSLIARHSEEIKKMLILLESMEGQSSSLSLLSLSQTLLLVNLELFRASRSLENSMDTVMINHLNDSFSPFWADYCQIMVIILSWNHVENYYGDRYFTFGLIDPRPLSLASTFEALQRIRVNQNGLETNLLEAL